MNKRGAQPVAAVYLSISQIILGMCLLLSIILIPHYFFQANQGGFSNYGTQAATKGLYIVGFMAGSVGMLIAASLLPQAMRYRLQMRISLLVLALLYAGVLISTFSYKLNPQLARLHDNVSIVLFIAMCITAVGLRWVNSSDRTLRRSFSVFMISLIAGGLTLAGILHILFAVQIVCGISFAYVLIRSVTLLATK